MINKIKQIMSDGYEWAKSKVKWFLVATGIIATVLAAPALLPNHSFENLPDVSRIADKYEIDYGEGSKVKIGGDEKDFKPEAKLGKWDDECWIKVKYPTAKKIKPEQEDGKLKWKDTDKEIHFYPMKIGENQETDAFEFDIILKKKPKTNIQTLKIETQGLKYYYQPPLTQEEIDKGHFRSENVVGSYAVYHESKRDHIIGQTNYQAGKAFHIYRPKIIDNAGNWVWGILNITGSTLTVEIPQEFLDNAVYPVKHATGATFGYTTVGSSTNHIICGKSFDTSNTRGRAFTLSEAGTLDSIHAALYSDDTETVDVFVAVYDEDSAGSGSHDLVASVERTDLSVDNSNVFYTFNAASEALSADTYILGVVCDHVDVVDGDITLRFDSIDSGNIYLEITSGADAYATRKAEDPWTSTANSSSTTYSIYCTYTPSAAERRILEVH